jgi:hypothetical protein
VCVVIRPEVQEDQPELLGQHMTVDQLPRDNQPRNLPSIHSQFIDRPPIAWLCARWRREGRAALRCPQILGMRLVKFGNRICHVVSNNISLRCRTPPS